MMLSDPRGQAMLDDFVLQWLEIADISRISRDDAAFTPALRDAMAREITLVFENAVAQPRPPASASCSRRTRPT